MHSDLIPDSSGNRKRLAYLYDKRGAVFNGLAVVDSDQHQHYRSETETNRVGVKLTAAGKLVILDGLSLGDCESSGDYSNIIGKWDGIGAGLGSRFVSDAMERPQWTRVARQQHRSASPSHCPGRQLQPAGRSTDQRIEFYQPKPKYRSLGGLGDQQCAVSRLAARSFVPCERVGAIRRLQPECSR